MSDVFWTRTVTHSQVAHLSQEDREQLIDELDLQVWDALSYRNVEES